MLIEHSEKHRGILADVGVLAKKIVDMVENARGIGAKGHARKSALKHGGKQRGANSLPRNVRNYKGGAVIAHREHIKVIPSHGQAREIASGNIQMRKFAEIARQQRLLDIARDVDFLLHALPFALAFHQPRVIQNTGSVCRQRVQDLPVQFGERRRAARIAPRPH